MSVRKPGIAAGLLAGVLLSQGAICAASPEKVAGSLVGLVSNSAGVPQMGATVLLFNRYDRLLQKILTNEKGAFGFASLPADLYSIQVTLTSFVPAVKRHIAVQPGMRSFLSINLASVLSSIELVYSAPADSAIMSDDWKWVLRSSLATRPILRLLPRPEIADPDSHRRASSPAVFSDFRGMFRVSGGDASPSGSDNQPDLGTAFALATSVFGSNQVQFSGNVGYVSRYGLPTAGFRTRYSRRGAGAGSPEVLLTMRQLYLPSRGGAAAIGGPQESTPLLRTMSLSILDRAELGEDLHVLYGFSLESVSFLERLNYFSPFARLTYNLGPLGSVELGYSNGAPPPELYHLNGAPEARLQDDLTALALFPRVSLRGDRARVQRAESFEIGFRKLAGSRTFALGAYREKISNAALTVSSGEGLAASSDLLPDLFSSSSIFNIGRYSSLGYTASLTQAAGERLNLTLAWGYGGVLRTDQRALETGSPDELRSMIRTSRRNWLAGKVAGTAPVVGTRFSGSYQWTDYRSLTPGHMYLTQSSPQAGLNFHLHQPLPAFGGLPGRLEASAELRNMLAQGYLSLVTPDRRNLLMVHSPRSVRGGLSFIF